MTGKLNERIENKTFNLIAEFKIFGFTQSSLSFLSQSITINLHQLTRAIIQKYSVVSEILFDTSDV